MADPRLKQFRRRKASLWQSAVDEVLAKQQAASSPAAGLDAAPQPVERPGQADMMIAHANEVGAALEIDAPLPSAPEPSPAAGVADVVRFCSVTAFRLAEARVKALLTRDDTELKKLEEELSAPFGSCDPKWGQVIAIYLAQRVAAGEIPYRDYTDINDFVLNDRLPDNARVAVVGDWGTGQKDAVRVLARIAARKPDVVIHLGDVYYSGTEHEFKNYFYSIWQRTLGLPKVEWGSRLTDFQTGPATFTLSGNHDMYAGGKPFYTVIDMLGQPASYFCLRNSNWQFIALDTGLHDSDPIAGGKETFLKDSEVKWLKHKIATADGRKTLLFSHHQLYSAFEKIADDFVNHKLLGQVEDILPQVTGWLWGHEHDLILYDKFQNVLGRCVGHGAFPVGIDEAKPQNPNIPAKPIRLAPDQKGGLFQHGYAMMELNGAAAEIAYYQYDALTDKEVELARETM